MFVQIYIDEIPNGQDRSGIHYETHLCFVEFGLSVWTWRDVGNDSTECFPLGKHFHISSDFETREIVARYLEFYLEIIVGPDRKCGSSGIDEGSDFDILRGYDSVKRSDYRGVIERNSCEIFSSFGLVSL